MKLKKLLKDIPFESIKGSKDVNITGICSHSKFVVPGNLFVAKRGLQHDGHQFIKEALSAGAAAILTEIYDPFIKNTVQIVHKNVCYLEGVLASRYYNQPSHELFLVGITGTNGKTTTAYMVKHLLDTIAPACGLIGTIEYIVGPYHYQATHTTPDVINNHKMLREMILNACSSAVMEVTSHGLIQKRVQEIDYDVAVFTNLSQDHLDYHGSLEEYGAAKAKLFESLKTTQSTKKFPKLAILNIDDPYSNTLLDSVPSRVISYGLNARADLYATDIICHANHTRMQIHYQGKVHPFSWQMIGKFNIYNLLASTAVGLGKGVEIEKILSIMASFKAVPGRLESIANKLGLHIYVDYSHTPDALEKTLQCLSELKNHRIITVFGCGGNRDASKRQVMARVAEKYSDYSIVTTDNPRQENPSKICDEVSQGFSSREKYMIEVDRRRAIEHAIEFARKEDIVLIAGKGHETYQIFSHQTIEFDDRAVAREACRARQEPSHVS